MRAWIAGMVLVASGCGRIGFDATLEASLVVGASTADLEICNGPARYWITTAPLADGWTADTIDEHLAAVPVLHPQGRVTTTACTKLAGILIDAEQIAIHAYVVADETDQAIELTATLEATWTRERTASGVDVWVHRPEAYYRDPSAPMPVLMFLHGWGHSTGVNANGFGVDTMPRDSGFLELFGVPRTANLAALPFLMVAPNCVQYGTVSGEFIECQGWKSGAIYYDEVMKHARAAHAIDAAQIYVTGLSTGGEGSFRLASERGSELAAVVPIASTCSQQAWFTANMCGSVDVPIWAFHSINDTATATTYENSKTLVTMANDCMPSEAAQVSLGNWLTGIEGHTGWLEVYGDKHGMANGGRTSVYEWLLAHARP